MKNFIPIFIMFLSACSSSQKGGKNMNQTDSSALNNFQLFEPVSNDYSTTTLLLPKGFEYTILFSEGDTVITHDNKKAPAKGKHDFVAYIPIENSSDRGYLYVSHESRIADPILGDGGGGTIFEIQKENTTWSLVGNYRNVNFNPVGGTINNCGGSLNPLNQILTAEENTPSSNEELSNNKKSFTNLKDFNQLKRFQNMGWMVLVDPVKAEAINKVYNFGRYEHEDAYCTSDGKTVYLTDDNCPGVFFKFDCEIPNDYSKGQLSAYQQGADGNGGKWLPIPMVMDSLLNARDVAIRMGATMFMRQEWVDGINGKIYITETGYDSIFYSEHVKKGGTVPFYLEKEHKIGEYTYNDFYGRILEFDPATNTMKPFIEGGQLKDGGCFSNPDGLTVATLGGKPYLIINEDIIGLSMGRVNDESMNSKTYYNEIYFLDLSITNPTRDDLKRFAVGPRGCETTGSWFTPDGKTYFISIQSPDKNNPPPFNKSCTVAITGF